MREHPLRSILSRLLRSRRLFRGRAYLSPPWSPRRPSSHYSLNHLPSRQGILHAKRRRDSDSLPPDTLCERSPIENYSLGETETSSRLKPRPLTRNLPGIPISGKESKRTPVTCSATLTFVNVFIVT